MQKNLKRKEFLEADKVLCQAVLTNLSPKNDSPQTIKAFQDWWTDLNEQLATFPEPA